MIKMIFHPFLCPLTPQFENRLYNHNIPLLLGVEGHRICPIHLSKSDLKHDPNVCQIRNETKNDFDCLL